MNSENKTESVPNDTTTTTVQPSAKNVCCGIYGLRNKANGKWYVGQSLNIHDRWKKYRTGNCQHQPKLYNALKKYGYDMFEKHILEVCVPDVGIMDSCEDHWIDRYNSIEDGYNVRRSGSHGAHSNETREKLRRAGLGRVPSEETKRKRLESRRNNGRPWHSTESIGKIRIAHQERNRLHPRPKKLKLTRSKEEISTACRLAALGRKASDKTIEKLKNIQLTRWTPERRQMCRAAAQRGWEIRRGANSSPTQVPKSSH